MTFVADFALHRNDCILKAERTARITTCGVERVESFPPPPFFSFFFFCPNFRTVADILRAIYGADCGWTRSLAVKA